MRQGQVDESGEKGTLCDSEANILPFQPMEHNEGCSERQVCRTKCLSPPTKQTKIIEEITYQLPNDALEIFRERGNI